MTWDLRHPRPTSSAAFAVFTAIRIAPTLPCKGHASWVFGWVLSRQEWPRGVSFCHARFGWPCVGSASTPCAEHMLTTHRSTKECLAPVVLLSAGCPPFDRSEGRWLQDQDGILHFLASFVCRPCITRVYRAASPIRRLSERIRDTSSRRPFFLQGGRPPKRPVF